MIVDRPGVAPERVVEIYKQRRDSRGLVINQMDEVRRAYNGEMVFPLPELDANEKQMVANLVQGGIDQTAMRIASVIPAVWFPPEREGKAARERARRKRDVTLHWWETNHVPTLKARRRARWLLGYSCAPVTIRAGGDREPLWRLVNPLACYPAPCLDPDDLVPPDSINVYRRSREWCERAYPDEMRALRKGTQREFEIVEFVDANEIVMVVCGAPETTDAYSQPVENMGASEVLIHRVPNRANRPLTIVPGRVTLDKPMGQYDGAIGMMHTKSMLMALGVIAQKRAIFPETWVVSGANNGRPDVVQDAEPMSGQVGIVENGQITYLRPESSVFTAQLLDRLEYEMKNDSFTPSQYGGYNPTNVRTGRAMGQLQEAVIDFPIQEAQEVFALAYEEENRCAIALAKAYQHKSVSFYSKASNRKVEYLARECFDDDVHEVRYALLGADARGQEISFAQKMAQGTLSAQTIMEFDPAVRDVEAEKDRILAEQVQRAYMQSLQTLASQPEGPFQPEDWALWAELVLSNRMEPYEATAEVIKRRKEQQAKEAAGQVQGPEAMPGLAVEGQPGAPVPAIAEPEESGSNLARTLANLRLPRMTVPAEQGDREGGVRVA